MVIATRDVDIQKVLSLADNEETLCAYIKSLIPSKYQHVDAIYNNTKYFINLCILENNKISMRDKDKLNAILLKHVRVVGYLGNFITCKELDFYVDAERVYEYYKEDIIKYGRISKRNY